MLKKWQKNTKQKCWLFFSSKRVLSLLLFVLVKVVFVFVHSSNYYIFVWLVLLHCFNFFGLVSYKYNLVNNNNKITTIYCFASLHIVSFFEMLFLSKFIILTFSLYFLSRYNQIDKHFQNKILQQIINGKLECNELL
jgi:hypothetical protein